MNVLLVRWQTYAQEFLYNTLEDMGIEVDTALYEVQKDGGGENGVLHAQMSKKMTEKAYDYVISLNYFPAISKVCEECGVKYVAWTVDSPLYTLYSRSIYNECNYFFVFDKVNYQDLKAYGVKHVWYLPLGSHTDYFDAIIQCSEGQRYISQVSFVGNLYTEKSAYHLLGEKRDYFAGYMEGLVEAQRKLWGHTLVEKVLNENWSQQLEQILNAVDGEDYICSKAKVFANSCLLTEVTARERREYLEYISGEVMTDIYTGSDTTNLPMLKNRGRVDYLTEMPLVFHNSKINLNITLRTIQQGISLRVWDVLACGGFLLTNYQPELEDFFEIGRDLECYTSKEDMLYKIKYYLSHEEERREIAHNGYEKVKREHGYKHRIQTILEKMND